MKNWLHYKTMIGAVDIGGTKIAIGLVQRTGQLIDAVSLPTRPDQPYASALDDVKAALQKLLSMHSGALEGIGIGTTGRLTAEKGIEPNQFLPNWSGRFPAADLSAAFHVHSAIENDADAAVLAEYQWGACAGSARMVYITISTGIGGGFILDGNLYRGVDGCHPEIGHHVIDSSGPLCFCGAKGCWERMASGTALADWAREQGGEPHWDARMICDLAEQGDDLAKSAVSREAHYLGLGLANMITLFAPECIVLGGGLMQRWNLFRGDVEATIAGQCGLVPWKKVKLSVSMLQHTGLAGAAATWVHQFGEQHDF